MKGAYFFISLFCVLISFTGKGQTGNNSDINRGKRTTNSIIPPQLSSPANNSEVIIKNPVFMWIPPRPAGGMMVTYSLRLVQVESGQTPMEALLQNPPLLNLNGLTNTFLSYPANAPALQLNAEYAWQVTANSGGQNLGVADVSVFSLKVPAKKNADAINYPVAAKVSKERFYVTHGKFYFAYNNTANENILSYTIKSVNTNQVISGLPEIRIRPGMNRLSVDVKQQKGALKNNSYYYLEIKDKKQQVYKLIYYYMET